MNRRTNYLTLVDDHPILLEGHKRLLPEQQGLNDVDLDIQTILVTTQSRLPSVIKGVLSHRTDALVIDYDLGRPFTGIDIARSVKKRSLDTKVIILTAYDVFRLGVPKEEHGYTPNEIQTALISAFNDKVLDKIILKSDENLPWIIRGLLHKPFVLGVKGRGRFANTLIPMFIDSDSCDYLLSYGKALTNEQFILKYKRAKNKSKAIPVDDIKELNNADIIIDCSSKLRTYQMIDVTVYEQKRLGKKYYDRRILFPYERRKLEESLSEIDKDKPLIDFGSPSQFRNWLRYINGHLPQFLYSPLNTDIERLMVELEINLPQKRFQEFIENIAPYMINCHGDADVMIGRRYMDIIGEREQKLIERSVHTAKKRGYLNQEIVNQTGLPDTNPPLSNKTFFEKLAHFETPLSVTGYIKFKYLGEEFEGWNSYAPKFNFKDLSVEPDWDWIDDHIGEKRFKSVVAPYLREQKNVFFEMINSDTPYKSYSDILD